MVLGLLALLGAGTGCSGADDDLDDTVLAERNRRMTERLRSDSGRGPVARWLLPPALREISGLALAPDGRLFAHSDESSVIYEIDYRHGTIVKHFQVGRRAVAGDFEALTIVGQRFFLLASNGEIYEFAEGEANDRVDYTLHDTRLGRECEFEGMAFDSVAGAMILACKNIGERRLRDNIVLYRVGLDSASRPAPVVIPLSQARGGNNWPEIKPSDLAIDPLTGNYFIIAAQQKGLIQVTREGRVVSASSLPDSLDFAEGLALTRDSLLIISTEATGGTQAAVQVFRRP